MNTSQLLILEQNESSMITKNKSYEMEDNHPKGIEKPAKIPDATDAAAEPIKEEAVQEADEPLFSIFTHHEKLLIVILAGLAALFSPLTASIYYPAIPVLTGDLNVSVDLLNLTVTVYLIFQGLAPSITGSISDTAGRRSAYLICFTIYFAADIGLALQRSYPALMVLRCIQACGSSGTIALANAVVADIVTSAQRGSYISYVSVTGLVGPALGPTIGGILTQYLGWPSIFWFLAILSGIVGTGIAIALPETCRKIVGNGSIPTSKWNMSLLSYRKLRRQQHDGDLKRTPTPPDTHTKARPNLFASFIIYTDLQSSILLIYSGINFAGFYMVIASLSTQLSSIYGLSTLQVGLCYLPTGLGSMLAALVIGRFLDYNFRRHARRIGLEISKQRQQDLSAFPIERARLEIVLPMILLSSVATIGYGWAMQARTNLAAPVIMLFFATFGLSGSFQGLSSLVVDLNRDRPGTATAAMNLARCWLGAGGTALVNPLIGATGIGWAMVCIAAVWLITSPAVLALIKYGPGWRAEKKRREEALQEEAAKEASA